MRDAFVIRDAEFVAEEIGMPIQGAGAAFQVWTEHRLYRSEDGRAFMLIRTARTSAASDRGNVSVFSAPTTRGLVELVAAGEVQSGELAIVAKLIDGADAD